MTHTQTHTPLRTVYILLMRASVTGHMSLSGGQGPGLPLMYDKIIGKEVHALMRLTG